VFRVSRGDRCFDADTIDQAGERLRREEPGLYRVDEIRANPFPCGHTLEATGPVVYISPKPMASNDA